MGLLKLAKPLISEKEFQDYLREESDSLFTKEDMMNLIDWCGGEEGFNLIDEGETSESLLNKFLSTYKR